MVVYAPILVIFGSFFVAAGVHLFLWFWGCMRFVMWLFLDLFWWFWEVNLLLSCYSKCAPIFVVLGVV